MFELVLQPLDQLGITELVGLSRLQRLLPRFDRLVQLHQLDLDIGQMIPKSGVAARTLFDRLLQRPDRFLMLAELEQDPAQAVEVRTIIGFRRESLANHLLGFFEVLSLIGPQITEIVVELSVFRIGLEDFF